MAKRKPSSASKYAKFRVVWACPECGGEGGDIVDCKSLTEAKATAKALAEDGKDVTIEGEVQSSVWEEIKQGGK